MSRTAVVIPIFKLVPSEDEILSINRTRGIFASNYNCIFVAPEGLDISNYLKFGFEFRYFAPEYFKSIASYNKFMQNLSFYKGFEDFEYILICQPDVYVFHDDLKRFTDQGYDYVGAPWIDEGFRMLLYHFAKLKWKEFLMLPFNSNWYRRVGNGGFSLRKVSVFLNWFEEHGTNNAPWGPFQEDYFWSLHAKVHGKRLYTPEFEDACKFALETKAEKGLKVLSGKLPMAVHAWKKYDPEIWAKYIN